MLDGVSKLLHLARAFPAHCIEPSFRDQFTSFFEVVFKIQCAKKWSFGGKITNFLSTPAALTKTDSFGLRDHQNHRIVGWCGRTIFSSSRWKDDFRKFRHWWTFPITQREIGSVHCMHNNFQTILKIWWETMFNNVQFLSRPRSQTHSWTKQHTVSYMSSRDRPLPNINLNKKTNKHHKRRFP